MNQGKVPSCEADVAVIGGGLIGCAIALELAARGRRVVVLERGQPGREASSAAAGMIAPQAEISQRDDFFELASLSRDLYPDFVARIEELSGSAVDYRREGTLIAAATEAEAAELEERAARQSALGLAAERLSSADVHRLAPGLSASIGSGLLIPADHVIDSERLAEAVPLAATRAGVEILALAEVAKLNLRGDEVSGLTVRFAGGALREFRAGMYVLAAGAWSGQLLAPLGLRLPVEPCRGQIIEFAADQPLQMVVRLGHHYLVPRSDGRVLAGSTAEYAGYRKSVTAEGIRTILEGTVPGAPFLATARFLRAWSGLRPDTADHLPVLGPGELPNLIFATGHFRNGVLLAPITARLIAELVTGAPPSRSIDAYRPGRFAQPAVRAQDR